MEVDWGDWHRSRKIIVMYKAVFAKFSQDPVLHAALLHTGSAGLVETMPPNRKDNFWGVIIVNSRGDAEGANTLGRILMAVRAELQAVGPFDRGDALQNSVYGKLW